MNNVYHIPAMLKETIEGLNIKSEGVYVDVTFGGGGHSRAILEAGAGHLYSFDQDKDALNNAIEDERWTFVHSNFRYLRNWMDYYGVKEIDGLLADLGVSFHHFDCPERGFSFRFSAPLDMRMNQTAKRTAADIVNGYSEEDLARIFYLYGELKNGRQIARAICQARSKSPVLRTEELVAASRIPAERSKELARLFQALRIEVNDELGALREMLVAAGDMLKPGGRIAILTYHSLEDRLVKNFLRSGNLEGNIEKDFYGNNLSPFVLVEKGHEASPEEVEQNPRARSAKLRIAEKRPMINNR
ncbi:MAG: 16S rRNA (cytosine(1402)-N(4))-methyltransferase RsmH [Paludibacteraceae bacterium]|nr:16S rRNA (cytosine(1402)-N(4))-methyltransferase RsmH [Paludibacteraceae bacterium]